jgi:mono/diheme cytochrome c family protein
LAYVIRSLLIFAVAAAPLTAQTNGSTERSAAQGTYSAEQAERGDTVFKASCASCHEPTFHNDAQFRMNWFGRTVFDLFKTLKTTMPEDNIGGLSDDEYTRVIAYILKLNGFPAGADSLRADTLEMRRIRIGTAVGVDSLRRRRR